MNLYKKVSAIDKYIYFADVHFSFFSFFSGPNIVFSFLQHNEFVMNVFFRIYF